MTIQDSVLAIYQSILKRIHGWILPLLVLLLLGSIYGRTDPMVLSYFSWTELNAVHHYTGWILCLVLLLFVYDFFFHLLSNRNEIDTPLTAYKAIGRVSRGMMGLINMVFYSLLFFVCLSGLLQYGLKSATWQPFFLYRFNLRLAHTGFGWLFVSAALIKYYLTAAKWLEGLVLYLRED